MTLLDLAGNQMLSANHSTGFRCSSPRLALDANCPIVPMAVIGTDRFFERFPRHTQVTIHILPPILPKPGETPLAPDGDTLRIYYGAADTSIAMATGSVQKMLQYLT
ncbi:MAG TPA: hypothetical protein PLF42_01290 [Anaerolineales bacterium]|nr:hypothetical protein [Anaerolineales bacterium]